VLKIITLTANEEDKRIRYRYDIGQRKPVIGRWPVVKLFVGIGFYQFMLRIQTNK
jgi:hypothetical protein